MEDRCRADARIVPTLRQSKHMAHGWADQGFITAVGSSAATSTLRICLLDPLARLDTPWPLRRLPQRATMTALGYYLEAHLHIVGVSRPVRLPLPALRLYYYNGSYSSQ